MLLPISWACCSSSSRCPWIIQIISFKTTGKRVFRMAPLQHHFELAGWSEVNIVVRFWIIAGIGVAVGMGMFYGDFLAHMS